MKKQLAVLLAVSTVASMCVPTGSACSFASAPYFAFTTHPDLPLKHFAAGQLGILRPGFARSYLLVAHRYLADKPLSVQEQTGVISLWKNRLTASDYTSSADPANWLRERATVPGVSKLESLDVERPVAQGSYQSYYNAQPDGFTAAIATLKALAAKFGIGSKEVKQWVDAQDQVFSNCGSPRFSEDVPKTAIPAALPAGSDPFLLHERNYQIAAANFYSQNFDQAIKDFEAIASQSDSRWKLLSAYLAVRAMIRKATLPEELNKTLLAEAGKRAKSLLADSNFASMKDDLTQLANFISARTEPAEHVSQLLKQDLNEENVTEITKTLDGILPNNEEDGPGYKYDEVPKELKAMEATDWICTMQSTDAPATSHAIEQWKKTNSTAWLVAAILKVDPKSPEAKALVAAAKQCKSQPAHWTLVYHANRIDAATGGVDTVKADLTKLIATPPQDLPPGSLNLFKLQRLPYAQSPDELIQYGAMAPVSVCSNGGTTEVPDEVEQIESTGKPEKPAMEFSPELADVLSNKLPLSLLRQLAGNQRLSKELRNNLAWTAWVRAILIGDDAEARQLAPLVKSLNPNKTESVNKFLAATTPETKKFAAVMVMLKFSSAQPNASTWGPPSDDDYGDTSGWWWGAAPIAHVDNSYDTPISKFDPLFLTPAQKSQVKQDLAKLAKVETAPNYFAHIVLPYAAAHPTDPRVPEALHLAVKCTRYGSTDDASKALSKQMFQLLHKQYKNNPWTRQTPYYY